MMTEALTKQPTLAELRVAARVLLDEDPSLTAARYGARKIALSIRSQARVDLAESFWHL